MHMFKGLVNRGQIVLSNVTDFGGVKQQNRGRFTKCDSFESFVTESIGSIPIVKKIDMNTKSFRALCIFFRATGQNATAAQIQAQIISREQDEI